MDGTKFNVPMFVRSLDYKNMSTFDSVQSLIKWCFSLFDVLVYIQCLICVPYRKMDFASFCNLCLISQNKFSHIAK